MKKLAGLLASTLQDNVTPENLGILLGKVSKEVSLLPKKMEKVTKEVKKGYNKGKK